MRFVVAFVILLLAPALPGAALEPLSPQPEGLAWPTDEWPTGSLPEGLDLATFEESVAELFASKGRAGIPDTRAILVVQGGRIVFEHDAEGFGPESRFQSFSMAKSITNALTGVLVRQGRLVLDERAEVPEWSEPGDPREDNPVLVPLIHTQGQFNRMRARHELMKKKYPDVSNGRGIPLTGLSNARPETLAIKEQVERNLKALPFDIEDVIEVDIPGGKIEGDWGH